MGLIQISYYHLWVHKGKVRLGRVITIWIGCWWWNCIKNWFISIKNSFLFQKWKLEKPFWKKKKTYNSKFNHPLEDTLWGYVHSSPSVVLISFSLKCTDYVIFNHWFQFYFLDFFCIFFIFFLHFHSGPQNDLLGINTYGCHTIYYLKFIERIWMWLHLTSSIVSKFPDFFRHFFPIQFDISNSPSLSSPLALSLYLHYRNYNSMPLTCLYIPISPTLSHFDVFVLVFFAFFRFILPFIFLSFCPSFPSILLTKHHFYELSINRSIQRQSRLIQF